MAAWQPLAAVTVIKRRAALYQQIRDFMAAREILEVDTPILSHYGIGDPYTESLQTHCVLGKLYMQTSPELCMKRLLAAGLGAIYQIAHVFRDESIGRCHQIEFTLLEWYRPGFNYYQLMDELDEWLALFALDKPNRLTYADAFLQVLDIDPHQAGLSTLQQLAKQYGWQTQSADRHALLDFLFATIVIKKLPATRPVLIYDYPQCMAALATLKPTVPEVSERFELFIDGMEIANGFNELTDAAEQKQRFEADLLTRRHNGQIEPPMDEHFIAALEAGLPNCAGIAVGLDRLLMVLCKKHDISAVNLFNLK